MDSASSTGRSITSVVSLITAAIAAIAGIIVMVSSFSTSPRDPSPVPTTTFLIPDIDEIRLSELEGQIASLRVELEAFVQADAVPNLDLAALGSDLTALDSDLTSLGERLIVIEQAVLDNPEKALELILFKKDIENINNNILATREEIDRTFGLYQFLLGSIAFALFSLAVSNFLPIRAPKEKNVDVEDTSGAS